MAKRKTYQPGEPRPRGKQLDGRYRGKVKLGVDMDGKPLYRYVSASSRPEMEAKKADIKRQYIEGTLDTDADMLFSVLAQAWYDRQKQNGLSPVTLTVTRSMLNKHVLPAFGTYQVRAISHQEVQAWLDTHAGESHSHINKLYTLIRSLFRYAVAQGAVVRDVTLALTMPEPKTKEPRRALTDEETVAVRRTIEEHPEGLFLAVLYYLGVRRSEALGLQWQDFDFDAGMVHIQRGIVYDNGRIEESGLKTAAANRYIPIPAEFRRYALARKGEPDAWVFHAQNGGPLSASTFRRMWQRLMQHAGMELTPHYFRHNYITMLYDAGVSAPDAMRIVGHADYQTTINIYTHIKNERLQQAGIKLDNIFLQSEVAEKLPKTKNFIVRIK